MRTIDLTSAAAAAAAAEVIDLTKQRSAPAEGLVAASAALVLARCPSAKPGLCRRRCRAVLRDEPLLELEAVAARVAAALEAGSLLPANPASSSVCVEDASSNLECGCCFEAVPLCELVQCSEGDVFCRDCLASYAREKVFGLGRCELACMSTEGCAGSFTRGQLAKALPREQLAKLDEQSALEAARGARLALFACPRCGVSAEVGDLATPVFECPQAKCAGAPPVCRDCGGEAHGSEPCGAKRAAAERAGCEDAKRLRVEEAMTAARLRSCPQCATKFLKSDGCNKMTCACGAWVCYVCSKRIAPKVGYAHFCQKPHCDHKTCGGCRLYTNDAEDEEHAMRHAGLQAAGDGAAREVEQLLERAPARRARPPPGNFVDFQQAMEMAEQMAQQRVFHLQQQLRHRRNRHYGVRPAAVAAPRQQHVEQWRPDPNALRQAEAARLTARQAAQRLAEAARLEAVRRQDANRRADQANNRALTDMLAATHADTVRRARAANANGQHSHQ